jgi:hypothetical protein
MDIHPLLDDWQLRQSDLEIQPDRERALEREIERAHPGDGNTAIAPVDPVDPGAARRPAIIDRRARSARS